MMRGSRPRILAVTYGGGHAAILAPVMAELTRDETLDVMVLGLTIAPSVYERHGLTCRGFASYLIGADDDALALGERLLADLAGGSALDTNESRAYLGLSMADLIAEVGEREAWLRYRARGRHAFQPLRTLTRILRAEQPDLVVTTNSPKSERAALRAALALGIDSVMVPDMFCDPSWEMYTPFLADHFAVISSLARRNLEQTHKISPRSITVTGQPAFDKTSVPDRAQCAAYCEAELGTGFAQGFLLIATSPDVPDATWSGQGSRDSEVALGALLRAAPATDGTRLVIKPHPSEPGEVYRALTRDRPDIVVAPGRADINKLLRASDGLIAASPTTTVIDALSLDVPVAVCSLGRPAMRDVLPWSDLAVPVMIDFPSVSSLGSRVAMSQRVPRAQEKVREEFRRLNAGATARVANLLRARATAAAQSGRS